jgi:uncharacterized phage-associated protein
VATTASAVADYFLNFLHDKGDLVTNLKLQKLVYYAQAWHLALLDEPLFAEEFEAWVHGPVQPALYQRFKVYGSTPITETPDRPSLPRTIERHLQDVLRVFGDYSAWSLERMVHSEDPWLKARGTLPADAPSEAIVQKDAMRAFYKQLGNG